MQKRKRTKLLNEQAVEQLLHVTTGERLERRDRAILEVLYGSGVRVSELCNLNVEDLHLEGHNAMVVGKGGKRRLVPLTPFAVDAIKAYLAWPQDGPLFRNTSGQRLNPRLCRRLVAKYAQKAGLPHSSPHTLRHSCASHMLANGAYLFHVKDLLGHQHPQTTADYLHRMPVDRTGDQDYRGSHPRGSR